MKGTTFLLFACAITLLLVPVFGRVTLEDRRNAVQVSSGAHISRSKSGMSVAEPNGRLRFYPNQEKSASEKRGNINANGGWVTSLWTYGTAFTYFTGSWFVPPTPTSTSDEQILFFFNSFEDTNETEILQPVLQWNNGLTGWNLACWYGGSAGYVHTTPVALNAGDLITGVIEQVGQTWNVSAYVNNSLTPTASISVSFNTIVQLQPTAQWVLETYYINQCSDYPPSNFITLDYVTIKDNGSVVPNPLWSTGIYNQSCGEGATSSPIPILSWSA